MTKEPDAREFSRSSLRDFPELRSDWLDEFARYELVICNSLRQFDISYEAAAPLSHRLEALWALKPNPRLSKQNASKLKEMEAEARRLLRWRAAIVHSDMIFGVRGSVEVAMFRNAALAAHEAPEYIVLSRDEFADLTSRLRKIRQGFTACFNLPDQAAGKSAP